MKLLIRNQPHLLTFRHGTATVEREVWKRDRMTRWWEPTLQEEPREVTEVRIAEVLSTAPAANYEARMEGRTLTVLGPQQMAKVSRFFTDKPDRRAARYYALCKLVNQLDLGDNEAHRFWSQVWASGLRKPPFLKEMFDADPITETLPDRPAHQGD